MKALIAAGGTGGHIYPGVAVAREIKRREPAAEILFVGTPRGLESKIIPREGFKLELMKVSALKGVSFFERIKSLAQLPRGFIAARRILKWFKPDVVIGVGGYSSGPMLLMAALRRLPTLIVEPNALPGFTNRVLARFVTAAAVSFDESLKYFRRRGRVTGNPVRADFANLRPKQRGEKFTVLIFGGSQGARAINTAMISAIKLLGDRGESMLVIHQTGESDFEAVEKAYAAARFENVEVMKYINDMPAYFERADIVISRAGATSVAEIAVSGKAALFIPFPFATDDHQRRNAEVFTEAGAGRMILQKELTPERLAAELRELIDDPKQVSGMEEASRKLGKPDAASRVVDLVYELAGSSRGV